MNLPFTPDGKSAYAAVALVEGIRAAGHDTDDVNVVWDHPDGYWLVSFNSDPTTRLMVPQD